MPHALTALQKDYLDYIRDYVAKNESSPRLDEIAEHFQVKAPTAHKTLETLQKKGYLYFGRDHVSGFFIRLIERAGSAEVILEVPILGKFDSFGEVIDFPNELGHFISAFVGAAPDTVFALFAAEDIPQASILEGDLIIFDIGKKPQPGDICIGPIGNRFFLIKIYSKTYDETLHSLELAQHYPIPDELDNPELKRKLNWAPMAHNESTHDYFMRIAQAERWALNPISPELIMATALRLTRPLAF